MKHGFLKVAAVTPKIRVADVEYNTNECIELARKAKDEGAKVVVFPELVLSGYTCQDLFLQETLIRECLKGLVKYVEETSGFDIISFIGLPYEKDGKLYNVAAVVSRGSILAMVPKKNLPNYGEFYEARHFAPGMERVEYVTDPKDEVDEGYAVWIETEADKTLCGTKVPFGMNILLKEKNTGLPLTIAVELCEDLWTVNPPSTEHAVHGADIIVNLSASNEIVCKADYRRQLVSLTSARLVSAYIYASAGDGESTQDLVFGGHNIIAENGAILSEAKLFSTGITYADIDLNKVTSERRKMTTYPGAENKSYPPSQKYVTVEFALEKSETELSRSFSRTPFVPSDEKRRNERCEEILTIQALGLKKRLEAIGCKNAVVGLSGGLDSTLALLVMVKAFDMLKLSRKGIHCVTMPCFGTTDRTYDNACTLAKAMGTTLTEVDLKESVRLHFRDIGQDESVHDVTYENGQARERTQVLMDIANKVGGIVVGTGDMSELALGWATYNGDHMSMYGVNVSVPKTLVRHLVRFYADTCDKPKVAGVLMDVLDTPVSPELLPPEDGKISQKTEDLVGPYELHDFFMYYVLRFGFAPDKIFRIAKLTFEGAYDTKTILKWEKVFFKRFFAQQFKRSCLPDGPKVGTVAVSPRGDLRMPSDAVSKLWLKQLEGLR